jgi:hypothetical protein
VSSHNRATSEIFKSIEPVTNNRIQLKSKKMDKENEVPNEISDNKKRKTKKKKSNATPDILSSVLAPNYKEIKNNR